MRTSLTSLVALATVALALGACGQKGPLYLPQDPAAPGLPAANSAPGQPPATRDDETRKSGKPEQQTQQHTEAEAVSK
ncbi:lipoprotein [Microbulbifer sp. Q7]|uniref:LPS translocon maturation chaperone LptM n=1 Tax=Microbulbifer sp. Q7 TaxID=1785091 RepID=UPI000833EE47|nr:lipoprotein [Microbulbifer sp. Q7]